MFDKISMSCDNFFNKRSLIVLNLFMDLLRITVTVIQGCKFSDI